MNTDNYDYEKSSLPQSLDEYTPFLDKQTNNYINDQNSGVYSSNQSLVQFDLSSLYSSSKFCNTNDMFLTIPIVLVSTLSVGAALTTPPTCAWALQTLKSGYHQLIHQADLQIDGKTVSESQPFLGTFTGIKLMSELSQTDLKSFGSVIGFSDVVDTPNSVIYNNSITTANLTNGNGLTNNSVFGNTTQTTANALQNTGVCNEAINKRALRVIDAQATASNTLNKIVGTGGIVSRDQLNADFKCTYQVLNTNYAVIYDVAIIRLKDILDVMDKVGLIKRFNGVLRLYINTGALYINCNGNNSADSANPNYLFNIGNSTFNNTCPFTINNLNLTGQLPFAQKQISAGLFIAKAPQTSLNGVNLSTSGASHPMQACRLYYSTVQLEPEKALSYSRSNQMKNIVFKNYYFNQINNVSFNGNYSQLIQSGITNPYALIIVPYISSTVAGMSGYQWQSPFDTAPATGSPCILSNLQVQLGGQQVLNSSYYYSFETFVTQFVNCESLSSSDFGVGVGVINKEWWDLNRIYYVNLSRSTKSDRMTPRNIVLSFKNDSLVAIDLKVFTVYLDSFKINVDSGQITTGQM